MILLRTSRAEPGWAGLTYKSREKSVPKVSERLCSSVGGIFWTMPPQSSTPSSMPISCNIPASNSPALSLNFDPHFPLIPFPASLDDKFALSDGGLGRRLTSTCRSRSGSLHMGAIHNATPSDARPKVKQLRGLEQIPRPSRINQLTGTAPVPCRMASKSRDLVPARCLSAKKTPSLLEPT